MNLVISSIHRFLNFPQILEFPLAKELDTSEIKKLQATFYENLPKITLNSEMAKRDFMIAPLLWEIIRHVKAKINVEYPIEIDEKLGGDHSMGIIYAELLLINPAQPTLKPVKVTAIVDTGAITLCIPEHIAVQLKLEETEQREVTTADTKSHLVPYMEPLKINYLSRTCYTGQSF